MFFLRFLFIALVLCGGASGQVVNLAKFQKTTASSSDGGTSPEEATDGVVSNDSRWYSNASGNQWIEVTLAASFSVGSAHFYLGKDDGFTVSDFDIEYANGNGWIAIDAVRGNTETDLNVVFSSPVIGNRFRVRSGGLIRLKEVALFPPNGGQGYPLGTGVNLNLVSQRGAVGSSTHQTNHPINAIDGYVDDNSRWLCANNTGPHSIEFALPSSHKVGSLHLYSGFGNGQTPLGNFEIEYANGNGWTAIPGGVVSGNTLSARVVNFGSPVEANRIRINHTERYGRIREVVVLPANGGSGYPIETSVKVEPKPTTSFRDYGDDWFRIAARSNNNSLLSDATGSTQATTSVTQEEKNFQLLWIKSLNAYRLRNQDSGKCIEVEEASNSSGAAIVEGEFSAAPHQLWRLEPTSDGYFRIVNVWSDLVIATNGGNPAVVTQQSASSATTHQWKPISQETYFKKGTGGWVGQYGTAWAYDWARGDKDGLGKSQFYAPMQHREGWPNLTTLHKKYHDWNNDGKPAFLLGFNEPDRPDQANMTVERAMELWPELMALDVPLVSPACAQGGDSWWLNDFMDRLDASGFRCDFTGGHWYSGPSSDNLMAYIDNLQNRGNGRPVWLTEFSVVDWSGGSGNWSEESNYNFILEALWRMEGKANLDKYAVFLFSGSSPASPWVKSNPRSNFFSGGGLSPFGKAYAAWDGERSVSDDRPYLIHNRNARHRLRMVGTEPSPSWIRREDESVQWLLQDAGNGRKFITSVVDGKRLRFDGSTLDFAPAGTAGPAVEWSYQQEEYGWHNIIHSSGRYLRLNRTNDANGAPVTQEFEMVTASAAASFTSTDWWFVSPYEEADIVPPVAPANLVAIPDDSQVSLSWAGVAGAGSYSVYRSVDGGSPSLIASEISGTSYVDLSVQNGVTYAYSVTATSPLELEGGRSEEVLSVPGPLEIEITLIEVNFPDISITWTSGAGRSYAIDYLDGESWMELEPSVSGQGGLTSYTETISGPVPKVRVYRVRER